MDFRWSSHSALTSFGPTRGSSGCLGGFLVPFMEKAPRETPAIRLWGQAGFKMPKFDFRVPGVGSSREELRDVS